MNYQRIYDSIISRAKSEYRVKGGDTYYEAHHIIPKCMGGTGTRYDYNHPNIVLLTGREHFLCHWLLHEIYPESRGLSAAFIIMCNIKGNTQRQYAPSSRLVEYARLLNSIESKKGERGKLKTCPHCNKTGRGSSMSRFHFDNCKIYTGVTIHISEEHKKKVALTSKGRKQSEETKQKRSRSMLGQKKTPEHIQNSVLAKKKKKMIGSIGDLNLKKE